MGEPGVTGNAFGVPALNVMRKRNLVYYIFLVASVCMVASLGYSSSPPPQSNGLTESHFEEWKYFKLIENKRSPNSHLLSEIVIYWKKEMQGHRIPIVVLSSSDYDVKNILSRSYLEVKETQSGDPFAKDGPKHWIVSFEVDPNALNRIYVGGTRPHKQMKSLYELIKNHNQAEVATP